MSAPMLTPDLLALADEIAVYYRAPIGTTLAAMLPPGLESRARAPMAGRCDPDELPPELAVARRSTEGLSRRLAPAACSAARAQRLARGAAPVRRHSRRVVAAAARDRRAPGPRAPAAARGRGATPPSARAASHPGSAGRRRADDGRAGRGARIGGLRAAGSRAAARGARPRRARLARPSSATHSRIGRRMSRPAPRLAAGAGGGARRDCGTRRRAGSCCSRGSPHPARPTFTSPRCRRHSPRAARDRARARGEPGSAARRIGCAPLVGDELAVLHSGLSAGERHDEWWRILRGEARVVIGTRTAAFAPLDPAAHRARRGARRRLQVGPHAALRRALGGAPACGAGRGAGRARQRHARPRDAWPGRGAAMPSGPASSSGASGACRTIEVVDLRAELAGGNRSIFSAALADALGALREGREQAVLLINRRGAATFILCRDCGESLRCPDCDLPFVYHLDGGSLRCHHCGRTAAPAERCPTLRQHAGSATSAPGRSASRQSCGRASRAPHRRVSTPTRWRARRGFETVYDDFREGRVDVLVGTQLAAKGLDLPSVTLAAVVAADVTLNLPDYRAAGAHLPAPGPGRRARRPWADAGPGAHPDLRAGPLRGEGGGRASTSTGSPTRSSSGDGCSATRRSACWPACSSPTPTEAAPRSAAEQAAEAVAAPGVEVLGPLPSYVAARAGRYRFQVVLRAPDADAPGRGAGAGAGRGGHRRRSRVAALIGTMPTAMAIRPILTAEEPILRERTKRVSSFDASLHRLLDDMLETMRDAPGVGLAANQVGVPLQVAVIEIDGANHRAGEPADREGFRRAARLGGLPLDPGLRGRGGPARPRSPSRPATGTARSSGSRARSCSPARSSTRSTTSTASCTSTTSSRWRSWFASARRPTRSSEETAAGI